MLSSSPPNHEADTSIRSIASHLSSPKEGSKPLSTGNVGTRTPSHRSRTKRPLQSPQSPRVLPYDQLQRYTSQELLELAHQAKDIHGWFTSAALALEEAYRRYIDASQLWNLAGAPVALTLQTHINQLPLSDDARQHLNTVISPLDVSLARQTQQEVAWWGHRLAEAHLGTNAVMVI